MSKLASSRQSSDGPQTITPTHAAVLAAQLMEKASAAPTNCLASVLSFLGRAVAAIRKPAHAIDTDAALLSNMSDTIIVRVLDKKSDTYGKVQRFASLNEAEPVIKKALESKQSRSILVGVNLSAQGDCYELLGRLTNGSNTQSSSLANRVGCVYNLQKDVQAAEDTVSGRQESIAMLNHNIREPIRLLLSTVSRDGTYNRAYTFTTFEGFEATLAETLANPTFKRVTVAAKKGEDLLRLEERLTALECNRVVKAKSRSSGAARLYHLSLD